MQIAKMTLVGDVKGKTCIIVDDMIDTGGTMCTAANALKKAGAKVVYASVVHGVLSEPAIDRINASDIEEFVVTDTIPMTENIRRCEKLTVLSVGPMLAEAIRRIHQGTSLSAMFKDKHGNRKVGGADELCVIVGKNGQMTPYKELENPFKSDDDVF